MDDPLLQEENTLKKFFERSSFFMFLLLILILAGAVYTIVAPHPEGTMELQDGQVAPYTVYADFDFQIEDQKKSDELAQKKASSKPDYYKIDYKGTEQIHARYQEFFAALKKREALEKSGVQFKPVPGDKIQQKVEKLSKMVLECLLRIADNPVWKEKLSEQIHQMLQEGILSQETRSSLHDETIIKIIDPQNRRHSVSAGKLLTPAIAGKKIAENILATYSSSEKENIVRETAACMELILYDGNLRFDRKFTEAIREQARQSAEKIYKTYHQNEPIVHKGKKVSEEDCQILEAYLKEQKQRSGKWEVYRKAGENLLLCLALILAMGLYLFQVQPAFAKSNRLLWQLGLITIASLLLNKLFSDGFLLLSEQIQMPRRELIYFALPVGFSSVLISVIFGIRTAFFAGLFVSAIAALPMENQFQMFFCGLLINAGGALAVRKVQNYRSYFVRAFLGTALPGLLAAVIYLLKVLDPENLKLVVWMTLFPFVTGLLTAILAQVGIFLLEMFFDVSTTMSLQSFYDFNHPLLKELQLKAPGTYHHCLMVSLLAEKAAEEAGLDPIKARVCGMFHDVGKLVQPEYFIENSPGRDMHKDQDPKMSAIIIRSHVAKHGIELARKYKLKQLIYDAITQHHGNDIIAFFYKKEQDLNPGKNILQSDFRYHAPLPSSKEISLVMLADCCEAASRSLDKPTPEMLAQMVDNIFRGKIRNNQLDESELTLHELAVIRNSFVNTLKTMFHGRIAYPKDDKRDEDDLFVAAGEKIPPS